METDAPVSTRKLTLLSLNFADSKRHVLAAAEGSTLLIAALSIATASFPLRSVARGIDSETGAACVQGR